MCDSNGARGAGSGFYPNPGDDYTYLCAETQGQHLIALVEDELERLHESGSFGARFAIAQQIEPKRRYRRLRRTPGWHRRTVIHRG